MIREHDYNAQRITHQTTDQFARELWRRLCLAEIEINEAGEELLKAGFSEDRPLPEDIRELVQQRDDARAYKWLP
jgi:hypothetical protein